MPRINRATPRSAAASWVNNLEASNCWSPRARARMSPDSQGYTPLANAASNCSLEAVKIFLSKGANVNSAQHQGRRSEVRQDSTHQIDAADAGFYFLRAGRGQGAAGCGRQGERCRHSRHDADPVRGLLRSAESGSRETAAQGGRGCQRQEFRRRDGARLGEEVRQSRK